MKSRRQIIWMLTLALLAVPLASEAQTNTDGFIDLGPSGYTFSKACGVSGSQQVGFGTSPDGYTHALVWSGTATSAVDLHSLLSANYGSFSMADGIDTNGDSVGYAYNASTGQYDAILWFTVDICMSSSPANGGTTSGGGTVARRSNVTACATANACYNFVNWTDQSSNVVSTSACYSFAAMSNETLVANFALVDSIGDGILDVWRQQYFGTGATTNSQSCVTCDADGTGQNNLFKYTAGLDPTNPASVFKLRIENVAGQPSQKNLTFLPWAGGRTYTTEFTTNLQNAAWTTLSTVSWPQTNVDQVTVTDLDATQLQKFYRIRITYP